MYNESLGHPLQAVDTPLLPTLAQSTVMDAFFMHALLWCGDRYKETLTLPHNVPQENHFDTALERYNQLMAGTGQPHYTHACLDCLKFLRDECGNLKSICAGTTDGVTIGQWTSLLFQVEIILDCEQATEPDFIMCAIPAHRAEEEKMQQHIAGWIKAMYREHLTANEKAVNRRRKKHKSPLLSGSRRHVHLPTMNTFSFYVLALLWLDQLSLRLKDLPPSIYNFFLDKMISIRNAQLVGNLERKGKQPFLQSLKAVKEEWIKMHPEESIV
ncbi:hypothetical protein GGX14DRAFT_398172 [Mycena pura]|uniref:Uncharacterized protein n=1 Tax=Mycena pura TaxID=153505 RepID=A0AAD6V9R0_9AGAR|nr:hypothetical protein GGX14DRAFT_398172 [Mycena pura]